MCCWLPTAAASATTPPTVVCITTTSFCVGITAAAGRAGSSPAGILPPRAGGVALPVAMPSSTRSVAYMPRRALTAFYHHMPSPPAYHYCLASSAFILFGSLVGWFFWFGCLHSIRRKLLPSCGRLTTLPSCKATIPATYYYKHL